MICPVFFFYQIFGVKLYLFTDNISTSFLHNVHERIRFTWEIFYFISFYFEYADCFKHDATLRSFVQTESDKRLAFVEPNDLSSVVQQNQTINIIIKTINEPRPTNNRVVKPFSFLRINRQTKLICKRTSKTRIPIVSNCRWWGGREMEDSYNIFSGGF